MLASMLDMLSEKKKEKRGRVVRELKEEEKGHAASAASSHM
jgi:hypothetical protein